MTPTHGSSSNGSSGTNGSNGADHAAAPIALVEPARPGEATRPRWVPLPNPAIAQTAADESVDLGTLARTVGRGWRQLIVGALVGTIVGLILVLTVRPWYRSTASVLIRNSNDPAGSLLSRFGLAGDLAGSAAGGALGGVLKSSLETEVQLLQSRELAGKVVDSLSLQARMFEPRGVPARAVFASGPIGTSFRRHTVEFRRQADGSYQGAVDGSTVRLVPGQASTVPGIGAVTLGSGPIPATFQVQFEDREDAITRVLDHLTIEKLGGDVVKVRYSGPDSLTAAAVPNALLTSYLALRRTVDRGMNERRYEFMAAQADTATRLLASAEDVLRREEEQTGVLDPELSGKSAAEAIQQVRSQFVPLESERQAAHALIASVQNGTLGPRQLAAFPGFLRSPGINTILSQITQLEAERTRLLGGRTERDPDVVVLGQSIADLERGLLPLAQTYATSLDRQTQELLSEQNAVQTRLSALPAEAQRTLRAQRDVKRLSQVVLGLQAQMIDARLAAMSEGGQVRQVDIAAAPKRPLFPRAVWTLPGGAVLGVLAAIAWVLGRSTWSARVQSADDAERVTGRAVTTFDGDAPVLLPNADLGTIVVIGVGRGVPTRAVAETLARQARARGRSAAVLDGPEGRGTDRPGESALVSRDAVARVEAQHDAVFVPVAPLEEAGALLDPGQPVAIVAEEGVTSRRDLAATTRTLERLGAVPLGIIVTTRGVRSRRR